MPGYEPDPAKDRRISRLSLISSAANLYAQKIADPVLVLQAAQMWENWIYGAEGAMTQQSNGATAQPLAPVQTGPVCAVCGNPLTEVKFKSGKADWSVQDLANNGQAKYGQILCKAHYFGKKVPSV